MFNTPDNRNNWSSLIWEGYSPGDYDPNFDYGKMREHQQNLKIAAEVEASNSTDSALAFIIYIGGKGCGNLARTDLVPMPVHQNRELTYQHYLLDRD